MMKQNQRGFGIVEMLLVLVVVFVIYYFSTKGMHKDSGGHTGFASDVLTNPAANKKTIDAVESEMNRLTEKTNKSIDHFTKTDEVETVGAPTTTLAH
jgi:hypothetical protein